MEYTLVLIKPDVVKKNSIGVVLDKYEKAGLKVEALKMLKMTEELASKHYVEHIGKPYYEKLVAIMISSPLVALVLSGDDAIKKVRKINGATNPINAEPDTIRAQFATDSTLNAVHASDSIDNANREIALFFLPQELMYNK